MKDRLHEAGCKCIWYLSFGLSPAKIQNFILHLQVFSKEIHEESLVYTYFVSLFGLCGCFVQAFNDNVKRHFINKNPLLENIQKGTKSLLASAKYDRCAACFRKATSVYFLFRARSSATAIATVAPTIGLLPIPKKPIISTWAGTEEEPANCASECMRPMVSVIP